MCWVYAEYVDDGSRPTSGEEIDALSLTTSKAIYTMPAAAGYTWFPRLDVTTIVQAIVDRSGWQEDNAITFVMTNGVYGYWRQWANASVAEYAPKLFIEVSS